MTRVLAMCLALSGCSLGGSMALGNAVQDVNWQMWQQVAPRPVTRCQRTYWGAVECREEWR